MQGVAQTPQETMGPELIGEMRISAMMEATAGRMALETVETARR